MLAFIVQSFPRAGLAPLDDAFAFCPDGGVQQRSALQSACRACPSHARSAWADDPAAIAAMQRKVRQSVGACFELIERDMLKGPWGMGEAYTICDPYLFTLAGWLEGDGVDLTNCRGSWIITVACRSGRQCGGRSQRSLPDGARTPRRRAGLLNFTLAKRSLRARLVRNLSEGK